jgi:hypothetical protein
MDELTVDALWSMTPLKRETVAVAYAIFDTSAIHVQREDHWSPNRGQPGASDPLVRGVEGAGLCILITILCGSDGG